MKECCLLEVNCCCLGVRPGCCCYSCCCCCCCCCCFSCLLLLLQMLFCCLLEWSLCCLGVRPGCCCGSCCCCCCCCCCFSMLLLLLELGCCCLGVRPGCCFHSCCCCCCCCCFSFLQMLLHLLLSLQLLEFGVVSPCSWLLLLLFAGVALCCWELLLLLICCCSPCCATSPRFLVLIDLVTLGCLKFALLFILCCESSWLITTPSFMSLERGSWWVLMIFMWNTCLSPSCSLQQWFHRGEAVFSLVRSLMCSFWRSAKVLADSPQYLAPPSPQLGCVQCTLYTAPSLVHSPMDPCGQLMQAGSLQGLGGGLDQTSGACFGLICQKSRPL